MATKKAGKSRKGSAGKKSASKKSAAKKSSKKAAGKKAAVKKGGAKKVGAKLAAKKAGVKKGAAKKAGAAAAVFAAAEASCIDIPTAEQIVFACAPNNPDINRPLCEFLAPNQLPFLQQCILNGVLARGCDIDRSSIPADCDSTLSDIIDAIAINARPA
jgi:hypothetical protein